ncbi:MAG: hypothetical protein R3F62_05425 [Planctomycetota bacterium]
MIGTDGGELVRGGDGAPLAPPSPRAAGRHAFGDGRASERIAARLLEALP